MKLPESIRSQFEIINLCKLRHNDLSICWKDHYPTESARGKKQTDAFWQSYLQNNPRKNLYNGSLCRLLGYSFSPNRAKLTLGPIEFKSHLYYMNRPQRAKSIRDMTGIGVSSVILTQDGQLLYIRRSESVGVNPGKLDVFGGHIDPSSHREIFDDGPKPSPFQAISTELMEEVAIEPGHIGSIELIGLIVNLYCGQPELLFRCRIGLTAGQIKTRAESAADRHEYSEIKQIRNEHEELQRFCTKKSVEFSPSGLANIWVHANLA